MKTKCSVQKTVFIAGVMLTFLVSCQNKVATPPTTIDQQTATPPAESPTAGMPTETPTPAPLAPSPVPGEPGIMRWPIPPEKVFAIDYDSETWTLSSLGNWFANSWDLSHRRFTGCSIGITKSYEYPHSSLEKYFHTLGTIEYAVTAISENDKLLYITYSPLYGLPHLRGQTAAMYVPLFVIIFGDSDSEACIQDAEIVFTTLRYVAIEPQPTITT